MLERKNVFQRSKYSPADSYQSVSGLEKTDQSNNMIVFGGGDLHPYINNIPVGNLESITWSISSEIVGNYVMGQNDAISYTTGKRVIVGSCVFAQYDRHAVLEQVFNLSNRFGRNPNIGSLWQMDSDAARAVGQPGGSLAVSNSRTTINPVQYVTETDNGSDTYAGNASLLRGIDRATFEREIAQMETDAARAAMSVKLNYTDQLPPFDLTLVAVNKAGDSARCSIFGMNLHQETTGYSQNDIGTNVGFSFTAIAVSPWIPLVGTGLEIANRQF